MSFIFPNSCNLTLYQHIFLTTGDSRFVIEFIPNATKEDFNAMLPNVHGRFESRFSRGKKERKKNHGNKIHIYPYSTKQSIFSFTRTLNFRQLPIPLDLHRGWVRWIGAKLRIHIHRDASNARDLLQLSLEAWSTSEVLQLPDNTEHSGKGDLTHPKPQALMRSESKVHILAQVAVQADRLGVRECVCIVAGGNLWQSNR